MLSPYTTAYKLVHNSINEVRNNLMCVVCIGNYMLLTSCVSSLFIPKRFNVVS